MRGDLPSLYSYLIADRPNPITFVVRKQKALHFSALQKNNPINFESGKLILLQTTTTALSQKLSSHPPNTTKFEHYRPVFRGFSRDFAEVQKGCHPHDGTPSFSPNPALRTPSIHRQGQPHHESRRTSSREFV